MDCEEVDEEARSAWLRWWCSANRRLCIVTVARSADSSLPDRSSDAQESRFKIEEYDGGLQY